MNWTLLLQIEIILVTIGALTNIVGETLIRAWKWTK